MKTTTETVNQDESYRHTTKTTDVHTWLVKLEQYGTFGDGEDKGKPVERDVMITCGTDTWGQDGLGFNVTAFRLTAKGVRQLGEFLLIRSQHMEEIERGE